MVKQQHSEMKDLPDFKAMPLGFKRAFWFCVGRIKHCQLWCSWCRDWGPWSPIKGKPDCHDERNQDDDGLKEEVSA